MSFKEVKSLFEDDIYIIDEDASKFFAIRNVRFYGLKGMCVFRFEDDKLVQFELDPEWMCYEVLSETDSKGEPLRDVCEATEYVAKLSREGIEKALKDKSDRYIRAAKEDYEMIIYDKVIAGYIEPRTIDFFSVIIFKRELLSKRDK